MKEKNTLKKRQIYIISFIIAIATFLLVTTKVHAADTGLQIQPELPDNQRVSGESFYDLILGVGKSQTLTVNLTNATSSDMAVSADVVPAQTGSNGSVTYEAAKSVDKLLDYNMANLVADASQTVDVPANSTVKYTTTVTMPTVAYDGVIAGGLIFMPQGQGSSSKKEGMSVSSQYRYVVALLARNEKKTWNANLEIPKANIDQRDYKNIAAITMQNTSTTYLNQLRVEATVQLQGSDKVYKKTQSSMQMAPRTSFAYGVELPDDLQGGTYDVKAVAYYVESDSGKYTDSKGQKYLYQKTYSTTVKVTNEKANELANTLKKAKGGTPWFIYAIIIGIILLIVLLIVIFLIYRKKRKENQKLKAELAALNEVKTSERQTNAGEQDK
jgi:cbb3-type cytochrome oxidase subunit 3